MKFSFIGRMRGLVWTTTLFASHFALVAQAQDADKQQPAAEAQQQTKPQAQPEMQTQIQNSAKPQTQKTKAVESADWLFQMRAGVGAGRVLGESNLRFDRLGVGFYAGRTMSDFDINLPFLDSAELNAGLSYHSFTAVDAQADRSWIAQSIGSQARVNLSPFSGSVFDLAVQAGVALQRMVQVEPLKRGETTKYGAAVTAGGYARTLAFDGVHVLGGVDLTLGSANWMGLTLGLESAF